MSADGPATRNAAILTTLQDYKAYSSAGHRIPGNRLQPVPDVDQRTSLWRIMLLDELTVFRRLGSWKGSSQSFMIIFGIDRVRWCTW